MLKTILFSFLLIVTLVSSGFSQQVKDHFHKSYRSPASTQVDFTLNLPDGTHLDCTKFIPDGTPPSGGWPSIIICHGFGLSKEDDIDWASDLSNEDYYSLVYSMRGQGNSTGQSNLISTTEMNDLMQIVQYVKNESSTNDNKVSIIGGSQGGIIPYMAVCNGMNVRCIISDLASPEFATSWIENGSIKMTFLWSMSYTSANVRYNNLTSRFRPWILACDRQRDKWDSLAFYVPQNRDFLNKVSTCTVPVYFQNAWQDKFFNTLGAIKSASLLPTGNFKMYFGSMDGHGSDVYGEEIDYQANVINDWFEYWLKGVSNNVMSPGTKYTYASTTYPEFFGGWTFERENSPSWPPAGVQNVRLYFHPTNQLLPYGYSGATSSVNFTNNVIDTSLTMLEAVNYEFTGSVFASKFQKQTLTFDTPALLQDAKLIGTPKVNLFYSSTANLCQYNFQIWEVRPNNQEKLVTRVNYTDRNYSANSIRQKTIDGMSHGHTFKAGDRIRIKITNLDNIAYDVLLRTNPHVLPVIKYGENKIYITGGNQSYIDLPMINFLIGIQNITTTIPQKFELYQNYPNPFNPSTKIKFDLPGSFSGNVMLRIFDVTGREVTTLVNQELRSGTYEVDWNAGIVSSGTYFYQLSTDKFTSVKKMVVVK